MSPVTFFSEWWSGLTIERPPVRVVSPLPPHAPAYDLVLESEKRAARAAVVARSELGPTTQVAGIWRELPGTRHLPDPYGPDPVVFGSVPRVGG